MPLETSKKQVSQRRRLQNQQAQRKYRERQKRHLRLLQDLSGYHRGISFDPNPEVLDGSSRQELPHTLSSTPWALSQQNPAAPVDSPEPITLSSTISGDSNGMLQDQTLITSTFAPAVSNSNSQPPTTVDRDNSGSDLALRSQQIPEHTERALIEHILQQDEVNDDYDLKCRILGNKTNLQDILKAGLQALSQKSSIPETPYPTSPYAEETESAKLTDSKIVMLENLNQDPTTRLPDIHKNHIRIKPFMFVAACMANAAALGLEVHFAACENAESPFFRGLISEEVASISCSSEFAPLKPYLRPSTTQMLHSHHPYIDVMPFPTFRDRVIKLISTEPPMIDEDDLCNDLQNDGLICWGSSLGGGNGATGSGAPWDLRSWEAQPWFLKKWWILIGGKEGEIYRQTQWWCELRGDRSCYPW